MSVDQVTHLPPTKLARASEVPVVSTLPTAPKPTPVSPPSNTPSKEPTDHGDANTAQAKAR